MHPLGVHLQVVSMANSGKNSNTSGFFITLAPAPQCDGKHVILGWVVEGLDVVQRIGERLACSRSGFAGGAGSHTGCSSRCGFGLGGCRLLPRRLLPECRLMLSADCRR